MDSHSTAAQESIPLLAHYLGEVKGLLPAFNAVQLFESGNRIRDRGGLRLDIMRATGPSVVIIQHLKSLGIKLRMPKKTASPDIKRKTTNGEIFGVPLQSLPLSKEGEIPQFVVDICQFLSCHLDTEGLFRKSGSVNRIKTLKAQLESGESGLTSAQPSDAAALLKQFFRELPHPLLTPELQDPLCQIQQSLSEEEKASATALVTCLLPAIHGETLRYLCTFLQRVASRSTENKMDSGNLAVVLAPSLFSNNNLAEKLTLATEKQLQLQASAIQSLIDNAQDIGQLPLFIREKISVPSDGVDEDSVSNNSEGIRRRRRRSMSGIVNDALSKLKSGLGPSTDKGDELELPPRNKTKRKASEDSGCGEQFTAKKRKSLREVADDNVSSEESSEPIGAPSPLQDDFGSVEVFSDFSLSPGNFLELNSGSPAVPPTPDSSARGQKGRPKRRNSKRGKRMPSGQISNSPVQLDRKEKVRNSLRLFQRARTAKQPTPEGKSMEPSGWNIMKRMVSEALEGPIFNGKEFRMSNFSLKGSNSGSTTEDKTPSIKHPSSPPLLRSSPSWKSLALNNKDLDEIHSGKSRRALRRSLSMPEKMGECEKSEKDQEEKKRNSLPSSEEGKTEDTDNEKTSVFNNDQLPLVDCLISSKSTTIKNLVSETELGSFQPSEILRIPNGHTSQYRSVRKLVLSFPWASGATEMDPQLKDWEQLSTHPIKRKGARRFGRSLSQESGLRSSEERRLLMKTDQGFMENTNTLKSLNGRNRQVFVSRKNITLSNCGSRSLDSGCPAAVDTLPLDLESPVLDNLLKLDKEALIFKDVVEERGYRYRGSPKCLLPGTRLEPISDVVDL
ncbi:rho GTPase-activating protein 11A-like [Dendropsophus ebraccatus]|uniref:rho GTPase-activating protein 11A-like n=1 Tax=Dendropsophus ebraccatus TaxID=150705 RepID=UPI0038320244